MLGSDIWAIEESTFRTFLHTLQAGSETVAQLSQHEPDDGVSSNSDSLEEMTSKEDATILNIRISGVIDGGASPLASLMGEASDPAKVRQQIQIAQDNEAVDGVMLNINSPGGKVTGIEMLGDEIAALSEEMPVHAHTSGMMASAAYWLGAQADRRTATPAAKIGSIAVVKQVKSVADMLDEKGIDIEVVRSGEYKQRPHPAEQLTSESVSVIEQRVESIHDRFVDAISSGLDISQQRAEDLADGRVYLPSDAEEAGLIDGIETPEAALDSLSTQFGSDTLVAEMRDPKYSQGDKVSWSWQGSTVHGKVAKSGDSFTVSGNTISGDEDEPVYKIDEYTDSGFKDGNVAKPESSLSTSDKDMSTDDSEASADLENRVGALEDSVGQILDAVTEDEADASEEAAAEPEVDPERQKAEKIVSKYDDRITPANREDYVALAMQSPEQAENVMSGLDVNAAEEDAISEEDATASEFGDMETFEDDIGRTEDGEMIATNETDVKLFEQLNLDYVDRT